MIPEALVIHRTAGRLRLKVPSMKGNTEYFEAAARTIQSEAGIDGVAVNPVTGSLLILYSCDAEAVIAAVKSKQLFTITQEKKQTADFHQVVTSQFGILDKQVRGWMTGSINIGGLAAVALVGAGVYQIVRGNLTAIPWYSAFWYALGIFSKSADSKPASGMDGD